MYSKAIEQKKKSLTLSQTQREILVGTLLGDGHLETKDGGNTYRLKIEHTIKQKEYVLWLSAQFGEWVNTSPKIRTRPVTFREKTKQYSRVGFATLSSGSLRFYGHQFYQHQKKVVPKLIHRWLTPLALAVWYMDDGSIKSSDHRTVLLNTHSFNENDLKRLQCILEKKYGIKTRFRDQKDGTQLYFLSETVDRFLRVIEPYIIPSMRYKLPKVWLTSLPKM